MSIYLGLRRVCLPFRNTAYPFLILFLAIHSLWTFYDATITSYEKHRPKREVVKITESSPISPYYPPSPRQEYDGFTRTFPVWKDPFPCGPLEDQYHMRTRESVNEGILYVKEMEASSNIFASVTARIARNMGRREQQQNGASGKNTTNVCTTRLMSQRAMRYRDRVPKKSFLWSVVREPVARLVSKFYHFGDVGKRSGTYTTTLSKFQNFVFNNAFQDYGYYFRSLATDRRMSPGQKEHELDTRELLESYDFLGVAERMDESLAVLKIILNLDIQDVLYLPMPKASPNDRVSDNVDYFDLWKRTECKPIPKPEISLEMKEWFYSEEFEAFIEADVMFYKAVNASLDRTIAELGRDLVEKTVKQVQWAQKLVQKECQNTRFPCSSEGEVQKKTDCLFNDIGCGYKCLDEVGEKISHDPELQAL